jgi:hypothetical protein
MQVRAMGVFVPCVTATSISTMLLLENSALKFDLCGVEKRSERDIFQSKCQLRGILSPP